jgi:quercetin dioxygenase-like cupin family protein
MKINLISRIEVKKVEMDGAKDVKMKILIGPQDGSDNIIMRQFIIGLDGHTPKHSHNYEHVVKVEKNKGIYIDNDGLKHEITIGQSVFVPPNEEHQFQNPYNKPFEFICVIPNPQKNNCTLLGK